MKRVLIFITLPCFAMEIPKENIFSKESAGQIAVAFHKRSFIVNDTTVQRSDLDETLRKVRSEDELKSLLRHNYLKVSKASNGEYSLTNEGRLNGGGPVLAGIAWVGIKVAGFVPAVIAHKVAKKKDEREGGHNHRDKHPSVIHHAHQAADNLEYASQAVHMLHGNIVDPAIEHGTSFVVDQSGIMHLVDPSEQGDHTYMATIMAMPEASRQQAQGFFDRAADTAFEVLSKLPGW